MSWKNKAREKLSPVYRNDWFQGLERVSAVLALIGVEKNETLTFVLTKRTDLVHTHKNQVSFPGGLSEPHDENLLLTALRESEEEVGLKSDDVEVLGQLDPVTTRGGLQIAPFLGVVSLPYAFRLNEREVSRLLYLPVSRLLSEGLGSHDVPIQGKVFKSPGIIVDGELIWGATARMLEQLRLIL